MKKYFILSCIIIFSLFHPQNAFCENEKADDFEQALNLSPKQIVQAKNIHQNALSEIKYTLFQIKNIQLEIEEIKNEKIPKDQKELKISQCGTDIDLLNYKITQIRKESSKNFENILSKKQKKKLEELKAEQKQKIQKEKQKQQNFINLKKSGFLESKKLFSSEY